MKSPSTTDKSFLEDVQSIFKAPEVLVMIRHVYGAGSRDFFILKNMAEFDTLLRALRTRDSVIVMKSFEKITTGIVDQSFLNDALAKYSDDTSWVLIDSENLKHAAAWAFAESRNELQEELQNRFGNHVHIIVEPDWISEAQTVCAYVPDEDGIVRPGAY